MRRGMKGIFLLCLVVLYYGKETGMKDFLFKSPTKVKFGARHIISIV